MKNKTLRLSTVSKAFMLALLLCGMGMTKGFAFIDFSVGGVSYHIITNTNTVEVTANSNPGYSGYVNIPSTVSYQGTTYTVVGIEAGAFLEETLVTDVSIPESVTYIGTNAFYGCHVRNLMIRSWSLTIGNGAFADANRLQMVTLYAGMPPTVGENAFAFGTSAKPVLKVRASTYSGYASNSTYANAFTIQTLPVFSVEALAIPTEGGSITGMGDFDSGLQATLVASPNTGYSFSQWTVDGITTLSTDPTYSFYVNNSATYLGMFTLNSYEITASADPAQVGTVSGGGTYNHFENCTLTATAAPGSGYSFINWTRDGQVVSQDATYTFEVSEGGDYVAHFSFNSYQVTASASPAAGGSVSGAGNYPHGTTCTLTATPATNYYFVNWTENGNEVSNDPTLSFTVNNARNLVAHFTYFTGKPEGTIDGLFSVSDSKIVWFSQGNLQYQASTNTWRFASNQWDFVGGYQYYNYDAGQWEHVGNVEGSMNNYISSSYNGWIDLFSWGTSGYNHGAYGYQPWSHGDDEDFVNYYAYGNSNYNLYDQTGKADWGYNRISNGENVTHLWRTLTSEEWDYLMNTRTTPSGVRYAKATVDGVRGVIVLPDNWETSYFALNSTNTPSAQFGDNTIFASDWATIAGHGALFLPVTGRRYEYSYESKLMILEVGRLGVTYLNDWYGNYWSSSKGNDSGNAKSMSFGEGSYTTSFLSVGTSAGGDTHYRFYGHAVRLVSDAPYCPIRTSCNPSNGGTTSGDGAYELGSTCTLTATANQGSTFINWTKNGAVVSTDANLTFTVTEGATYVANFAVNHTINATANPSNGGSVAGTGSYPQGTNATLTATSQTGYMFVSWTENGTVVSNDNPYTFEVTGPRSLVANFETIECHWPQPSSQTTMTYTGYVSIDGTIQSADYLELGAFCGDECRGRALPMRAANGMYLYFLSIAGETGRDMITFKLYDHHLQQELDLHSTCDVVYQGEYTYMGIYEYTFISRVQINATSDPLEGGILSGQGGHFPGLEATLTATPNIGYTFDNWTLNGTVVSTDANYTFTVTEAADYVAHFSINSYAIGATTDPEGAGTIEGTGTYNHFESCTLTATAATGYTFINWTLNGEEVGTETSFIFQVSGTADYVAHFSLNSYEIAASVEPEGTGTVAGMGTYDHFASCTLTATPATGYSFANWTLNGEVVSTNAEYSFEVSGPATYVAHFSLNNYTITAGASPAEGGTVSGAGSYAHFATCTLTATANNEFQFNSWMVNGETVSTNATYTFQVSGEVTVTAVFDFVQEKELEEGWDWWSSSIEMSVFDALSMLENSLGEQGIIIKSSDYFVQYIPSMGRWMGTLSQLLNERGYKVNVSSDCVSHMHGGIAQPLNHPITIHHLWNWIGYPCRYLNSVGNALASFQPSDGDIVKGQSGFATYVSGQGWLPSDFEFVPGRTYLYYSNNENNTNLTFAESRGDYIPVETADLHWRSNHRRYADNLCLMAVVTVDGEEQRGEDLELGAFVDGECRGSAKLYYMEAIDRYYAMMTITGQDGEQVSFALTDGERQLANAEGRTHLTFVSDAMVGSYEQPFAVAFGANAAVGESSYAMTLYPNPVEHDAVFGLDIPEEEQVVELTITDMLGAVVRRETGAIAKRSVAGLPTVGVYMVKAVCRSGRVYQCKLMVK